MSDVTIHPEFRLVRDDIANALKRAENARRERLEHERDMLATCERQLSEAKERAQKLPEVIAQYSADVARLEAMTAADILRELLPAPEPEQPTVAEHVKAPQMYAIWNKEEALWWAKPYGWTSDASMVAHYSEYATSWQIAGANERHEAYRLDDLHTVDGLLKIKPGSKPAMLPGQVRT